MPVKRLVRRRARHGGVQFVSAERRVVSIIGPRPKRSRGLVFQLFPSHPSNNDEAAKVPVMDQKTRNELSLHTYVHTKSHAWMDGWAYYTVCSS